MKIPPTKKKAPRRESIVSRSTRNLKSSPTLIETVKTKIPVGSLWVLKHEEIGSEIYSFVLGIYYKEPTASDGIRLYELTEMEKIIIDQSIMFMSENGVKAFRLDADNFFNLYTRLV